MAPKNSIIVNPETIQEWINSGFDVYHIREILTQKGLSEELISVHVKEFKKIQSEIRRPKAFKTLGLGAFLGFISCVLSIINPFPELYNLILFGLTSIAITIIFIGLYWLFE